MGGHNGDRIQDLLTRRRALYQLIYCAPRRGRRKQRGRELEVLVFFCLPVSLFASDFLSACLSDCMSDDLSGCLSVCLSVCLFDCLCDCLSDGVSDCLCLCLSFCLSICLSVCLSSFSQPSTFSFVFNYLTPHYKDEVDKVLPQPK